MMLKSSNLRRYHQTGFPHVHGWCAEQLFVTIDLFNEASINKSGGCLEIGVHHGKFFILLNQVIENSERSFAIDIFENQDLNIDRSGCGSLQLFQANLQKFDAHGGRNTTIIVGDSTDPGLRLEEQIPPGSLRLISVDGGHTVEHTVSDLILASRLISNQGVVILDDILNSHWLGVIEGTGRFLDRFPTLVPFAIGHQ